MVISFVMILNHPKQEVSPVVAFGHTCARNTKNPVLHLVHGSLRMIVGMNFGSKDASTTTARRPKKVSYDGRHTHTHTRTHTHARTLLRTMLLILLSSSVTFLLLLHFIIEYERTV